jgi:hypothetical protein
MLQERRKVLPSPEAAFASAVKVERPVEQNSPLLKRLANLFALLQERGRG